MSFLPWHADKRGDTVPFHCDAADSTTVHREKPTVSYRQRIPADGPNHRTNTAPRIRQTAARISDGSRFRRLTGSSRVLKPREYLLHWKCLSLREERWKKMK